VAQRIRLRGLRQNTVGHTAIGLWRHPDSRAHEYRTLGHWIQTAQVLERGRFDALFIADALGPLDTYRGRVDESLRDGTQTPCDDPVVLLPALAAATERLGLAVTPSTTFEQPYALARRLTSLDHYTDGRVGWNVVTSSLESAARNLGLGTQIPHDERYARAEEYMDVVYAAWEGSWEDDAVVFDRDAGVFADPAKVHPIAHRGRWFSVSGIALSEPSPRRTPAIYQAGASPVGMRFAARHAEGVFLSAYTPGAVQAQVREVRRLAAKAGRDPALIRFLAIMTVVVADTDEAAAAKHAELQAYASTEGALARWSALMQIDLSALDLDAPLQYVDTDGIRSMVALFTTLDPERTWTPREIARFVGVGGGGPVLVGSPQTVSDGLERWIDEAEIDGFNLADPIPPNGHRAFVDLVVPELQRRGRVWREYEGATLREHLQGAGQAHVRDDHPAAIFRR
jgi:FMN-dependent oxidoreductase (nitrilotriacetate monooxygenase family)